MAKKGAWVVFATVVSLLVLLSFCWPNLTQKIKQQRADTSLALVNEWDDLVVFAAREHRSLPDLLDNVKALPVQIMSVPDSISPSDEQLLRGKGFVLLWRRPEQSLLPLSPLLRRIQEGDGLFSGGEMVIGYPSRIQDVAGVIMARNGFIPVFDMKGQKGVGCLASLAGRNLVKCHVLEARELLASRPALWKNRLLRAVKERWVRLLYLNWSPALSMAQNIQFQREVVEELRNGGFQMDSRPRFPTWGAENISPFRFKGAFLISLLSPVMALLLVMTFRSLSPVVSFLLVCLLTLLSGVVVHGLGASPGTVLGLVPIRGVKLQLVVPLLFALAVLVRPSEWRRFMDSPIKGKHLFWGGGAVLIVLAVYLMRSGNFPLLPVLDGERILRDRLEDFFLVRPRFKEVLIGHPALLTGLMLMSTNRFKDKVWLDGRLWIFVGLIGQISILNTFFHFQSPFSVCLLRTLNGMWLGLLFSVPSFLSLGYLMSRGGPKSRR